MKRFHRILPWISGFFLRPEQYAKRIIIAHNAINLIVWQKWLWQLFFLIVEENNWKTNTCWFYTLQFNQVDLKWNHIRCVISMLHTTTYTLNQCFSGSLLTYYLTMYDNSKTFKCFLSWVEHISLTSDSKRIEHNFQKLKESSLCCT